MYIYKYQNDRTTTTPGTLTEYDNLIIPDIFSGQLGPNSISIHNNYIAMSHTGYNNGQGNVFLFNLPNLIPSEDVIERFTVGGQNVIEEKNDENFYISCSEDNLRNEERINYITPEQDEIKYCNPQINCYKHINENRINNHIERNDCIEIDNEYYLRCSNDYDTDKLQQNQHHNISFGCNIDSEVNYSCKNESEYNVCDIDEIQYNNLDITLSCYNEPNKENLCNQEIYSRENKENIYCGKEFPFIEDDCYNTSFIDNECSKNIYSINENFTNIECNEYGCRVIDC